MFSVTSWVDLFKISQIHKIRVIVLLAFQPHELFVLPLAAHPQEWLLVFAFYVLS